MKTQKLKLKNPMHGICGAEAHRYTRHLAGDGHDTARRHNEQRRADLASAKLTTKPQNQ